MKPKLLPQQNKTKHRNRQPAGQCPAGCHIRLNEMGAVPAVAALPPLNYHTPNNQLLLTFKTGRLSICALVTVNGCCVVLVIVVPSVVVN